MKKYRVDFTPKARKIIRKLDCSVRQRIEKWIKNNLEGCENPGRKGKPLEGEFQGFWRYRVGDYELLQIFKTRKLLYLSLMLIKEMIFINKR